MCVCVCVCAGISGSCGMEGGPFVAFVARRRPPPRQREAHCATSLLANWGPGCEGGIGVVTQTIAKEKKKNERRIGELNGPFLV